MSKVKKANDFNKAKAKEPELVTVSFKYLTHNDKFNFNYWGKDVNKRRECKESLLDRIVEITKEPWLYWYNLPKTKGIESIDSSSICFQPNEHTFIKGSKVIIFRFGGGDYRLLGFKEDDKTLYIIGFDFDHSAYNHGS